MIERHEVAGAASGKSGGFLALDWCRGTPLDRLARRSFALHAELAGELGNPWGYRRLETYAGHAAENETRRGGHRPATVAVRQRDDHGPARLAADDGAGRAARLHHGPDARRRGAGRDAAARHGRGAGARPERRA